MLAIDKLAQEFDHVVEVYVLGKEFSRAFCVGVLPEEIFVGSEELTTCLGELLC